MFIKIKTFFTLKYAIKKVKRQHRRGKIFANHFSDMELVSRYVKNSYNSVTETIQLKMNKGHKQTFL